MNKWVSKYKSNQNGYRNNTEKESVKVNVKENEKSENGEVGVDFLRKINSKLIAKVGNGKNTEWYSTADLLLMIREELATTNRLLGDLLEIFSAKE